MKAQISIKVHPHSQRKAIIASRLCSPMWDNPTKLCRKKFLGRCLRFKPSERLMRASKKQIIRRMVSQVAFGRIKDRRFLKQAKKYETVLFGRILLISLIRLLRLEDIRKAALAAKVAF